MTYLVADAGLPMIAVYWPPAWLALVPVIGVEAWWARRTLLMTWKRSIATTAAANLVSTLIGMPLAWFLWAALELRFFGTAQGTSNPATSLYAATVQAAWLLPYENDLWWLVPTASVALTAVFFLVSVGTEWLVMRSVAGPVEPGRLRRCVWRSNVLSYGIILLFVITFLYVSVGTLNRIAMGPVTFLMDAAGRAANWLRVM